MEGVPVRVHDQCLTSEVLGSLRCDCKEQLEMALKYISEHGGCVIYLQQVKVRWPKQGTITYSYFMRAVLYYHVT